MVRSNMVCIVQKSLHYRYLAYYEYSAGIVGTTSIQFITDSSDTVDCCIDDI